MSWTIQLAFGAFIFDSTVFLLFQMTLGSHVEGNMVERSCSARGEGANDVREFPPENRARILSWVSMMTLQMAQMVRDKPNFVAFVRWYC